MKSQNRTTNKLNGKLFLLLPFISSLLLALAFTNYDLGWIALVALLPLLQFWQVSRDKRLSAKTIVIAIWLAGLLFFLLNQAMLLFTRPEYWSGIQGLTATSGLVFAWLYSALAYSFGYLVIGLAAAKLKFIQPRLSLALLSLPAVWVLSEYLRSWVFSLAWWGSQATPGPHWNFGALGFAATATPLAYLGRLGGLFGLSFAVVAINLALYWLITRRFKPALIAIMLVGGLTTLSYLWLPDTSQPPLAIGLMQLEQYGQDYRQELLRGASELGTSSAGQSSALLILPEYSDFHQLDQATKAEVFKLAFANKPGQLITVGSQTDSANRRYSEIVYADQSGNIVAAQRKTFLIPIGEYLPKALEGLLALTASQAQLQSYREANLLTKGVAAEKPVSLGASRVGTLACSGLITPELYRQLSRQGASVLVNSASLDRFSQNDLLFGQAKQMARFHAIANGKPFLQAVRGGYAYVIDANGKFLAETDDKGQQFVRSSVQPSNRTTPYSKWGEILIPLSIVALLVLWLLQLRQKP